MTDLSLLQLILANLALAAGACLQGVAGYGIGTLAAPLLFLISPTLLPAPLILNAVCLTLMMLIRNQQSLQLTQVRFAVIGGIVGTLGAALTLHWMSPKGFELAFGVLILVAVVLSVGGFRPALNAKNSVLAGAASTYMGTITAVGGPPIAMIYQDQKGALIRANLSAFFLVASVLSLSALLFTGYLGSSELRLFAATLPGVLAGFWLSGRLINHLPVDGLRPLILGIAALTGVAAIARSLFG